MAPWQNDNSYLRQSGAGQITTSETAGFMAGVYLWMTIGLLLTAITGYTVSNSPYLIQLIFGHPYAFYGILIGELALVFLMSWNIQRISALTATIGFMAYAFMTGITFSTLFLAYTLGSMGYVFTITAGMFGAMAVMGYITKKDLSAFGTFFVMALIGIILAQFANFFIHSPGLSYGLSMAGVVVFAGLTAFDVQRIKAFHVLSARNDQMEHKFSVFGALILYLDFINMFLSLLRLFGNRRR